MPERAQPPSSRTTFVACDVASLLRCRWRIQAKLPPKESVLLDADNGAGWELAESLLRPRAIKASTTAELAACCTCSLASLHRCNPLPNAVVGRQRDTTLWCRPEQQQVKSSSQRCSHL